VTQAVWLRLSLGVALAALLTAAVVIAFGVIATSGVYGSRMAWLLGVAMPLLALSALLAWLSTQRRPAAALPAPRTQRTTARTGRVVLVSAAALLGIPAALAAMLLTTYGLFFVFHGLSLLV
jgi:hypothetical protein